MVGTCCLPQRCCGPTDSSVVSASDTGLAAQRDLGFGLGRCPGDSMLFLAYAPMLEAQAHIARHSASLWQLQDGRTPLSHLS